MPDGSFYPIAEADPTDLRLTSISAFGQKKHDAIVPAGRTVEELVRMTGAPDNIRIDVFVGEHWIPQQLWHRVRPKAGTSVSLRVKQPGKGGDGSKNPLATILMIAVVATAAFVSGGGLSFLAPRSRQRCRSSSSS